MEYKIVMDKHATIVHDLNQKVVELESKILAGARGNTLRELVWCYSELNRLKVISDIKRYLNENMQ